MPSSRTARQSSEPVAPSKRAQVADALRAGILSGALLPGTRLVERELCERMQASRPLVREAILQLEMEGFIYSSRNRGSVVATLTAQEAMDIYQVRGALEGLAAKSFIALATPQERAALHSAMDAMLAAIQAEDVPGQLASIGSFYDSLLDGCCNQVLAGTLRVMHSRIARLRATSITSPGRIKQSYQEMRQIVDAIDANDEQAAWSACIRHMELTAAVAVKVIGRIQARQAPKAGAA